MKISLFVKRGKQEGRDRRRKMVWERWVMGEKREWKEGKKEGRGIRKGDG